MAEKKRPAKKSGKATAKKSATATAQMNEQPQTNKRNRQIGAIILFAFALLLLFIILIEGVNVWNFFHSVLFGLFGICAIAVPFVLGGISLMLTFDRTYQKIRSTIIEAVIFIITACAVVQVFAVGEIENISFFSYISSAFAKGMEVSGGGAFGAIIGYPLLYLFGKAGSIIILILALLVVAMIITGVTLKAVFKGAAKPVKKLHKHRQTRNLEPEIQDNYPTHPVHSDMPFDLDHDVRPSDKKDRESKRKRLIDAYTDKPKKDDLDEIIKNEEDKELEKKPKSTKQLVLNDAKTDEAKAGEYRFPPLSLLEKPKNLNSQKVGDEMKRNAAKLIETLSSFGIGAKVININRGPAVTRYELEPDAGIKISKIKNLEDDISMSVAAQVRIEAPIPNTSAVGIEIPNKNKSMVTIREALESAEFGNSKSKLTVSLGKDITGTVKVCDLAKMPHLLIAGTTGSGKSVCTNSMIVSLLCNTTPDEVKLLLIDPKVVEFGMYNGIPQLLVPVVTDPQKAAGALGWAVVEMEKRYKMFADCGVRDLKSYNNLCKSREDMKPMPQIVIIIDELADLMMTAKNEVETSICRLAQKARAAGMHMVVATQRPSVDVITGLIKSNIPSRIALTVKSSTDSRTMIDIGGAEKLLGNGDMLYSPMGLSKPLRVQGCFVSEEDVSNIVNFIKQTNSEVEYDEAVINEINRQASEAQNNQAATDGGGFEESDPLTNEAIDIAVSNGTIATSLLQRKLKIGYGRAARIIDEMEERGIVGPFEGKTRRVLISKQEWLEMQARQND